MARPTNESRPLLPSDHRHHQHGSTATETSAEATSSFTATARRRTKRFLTSKTGHYAVLLLVSLDISSIFADLLLQILTCEGRVSGKDGGRALEALGIVSLVFSCLFMAELMASLWSFGWKYLKSWFHCLDATVIIVAFVVDVLLKGVLEEVGSLVVTLRLWRVFKIIEELSAGAEEQMEPLRERLEEVEKENTELREEIEEMKRMQNGSVV